MHRPPSVDDGRPFRRCLRHRPDANAYAMNDAMSGRALNDRANDYDVHDRMNGSNEASAVDGFDGVAVLDVCTCRIRSDFRHPDAIYTARCTTTAWWRSFVVGLIVDSN